jgi:hypothetical protein
MNRKFGALGVACLAVLAMSAIFGTAAQANPTAHVFTAAKYPATLTGSNPVGKETFTTEGGVVKCASSFHGELTGRTQTLTATPTYTGCEAFGFVEAKVIMNGCNYLFHLTTLVPASTTYQAHVDVVCPAGKVIEINAGTCKITIGGQNGLTTVDLQNVAGGKVSVTPTVANIGYTVTQDGFGCPFAGTGAKGGATYTTHQAIIIEGEEKANPANKISIDIGA